MQGTERKLTWNMESATEETRGRPRTPDSGHGWAPALPHSCSGKLRAYRVPLRTQLLRNCGSAGAQPLSSSVWLKSRLPRSLSRRTYQRRWKKKADPDQKPRQGHRPEPSAAVQDHSSSFYHGHFGVKWSKSSFHFVLLLQTLKS